jgi:tetratricopeptide (TPR) repeat protein
MAITKWVTITFRILEGDLMRKGFRFEAMARFAVLVVLFLLALIGCSLLETKKQVYRRCMKCADRAHGAMGISILKRGEFGCEPLPASVSTPAQARRFYYEAAWKAQPSRSEAPLGIAMTWWEEGDYTRALGYFESARERRPQDPSAAVGLVTMYRLLGRYPEAMAWAVWAESLKGMDGRKVSVYLRGRIFFEEKRYDEAEPLLEEALRRAEKTGFFLGKTGFTMVDTEFYLAQVAVRKGDLKKADSLFRAYVKRNHDPDFADYVRLVFARGSQDQRAMYDEIESCWVRQRQ